MHPILLLAVSVVAALLLSACGDDASADEATIEIHFSAFGQEIVTATAGKPITITLVNSDPIEHEWLVGDAAFHERHRAGTESVHNERPTEVTLGAFTTRTTTVTFDEPGDYLYICHLPGHEEYGMVGTLRVTEP